MNISRHETYNLLWGGSNCSFLGGVLDWIDQSEKEWRCINGDGCLSLRISDMTSRKVSGYNIAKSYISIGTSFCNMQREMIDTTWIGQNMSLGAVVRPSWKPNLMCGGRNTGETSLGFLKDNASLAYYNLKDGSTINLTLKSRGGRWELWSNSLKIEDEHVKQKQEISREPNNWK